MAVTPTLGLNLIDQNQAQPHIPLNDNFTILDSWFTPQNNITAAGTTQGTATALTAAMSAVTTVAAGTGVRLVAAAPQLRPFIANAGANALLVYPATGGKINALAVNAPLSVPAGRSVFFFSVVNGSWYAIISS